MNYGQFKLKDPNGEKSTLISFVYNFKGRRFVYSTGEKIKPEQWNKAEKQPLNVNGRTAQAKENKAILTQLERYRNFLIACINNSKINGSLLTNKELKRLFDLEFKITPSNEFIVNVFNIWLKQLEDKREHTKSTISKYTTQCNNLLDYEDFRKKRLTFADLPTFYDAYISYSRNKKNRNNNTLHRQMAVFKGFFRWCYENGYTKFNNFSKWKPMKFDSEIIALTRTELELLITKDLNSNKKLDRVRDLFVLGCLTGGRFSDYSTITKANIFDKTLRITQIKTGKQVNIPLLPDALRILKKYDYGIPSISNQKFNDYLKELFLDLKFFDDIKHINFIGKTRTETIHKKWELITSHTARKTFITLSLEAGMRQETVMKISGHTSYESFKRYMKVTDTMALNEAFKAWGFLENNQPQLKVV
jgi:integrase